MFKEIRARGETAFLFFFSFSFKQVVCGENRRQMKENRRRMKWSFEGLSLSVCAAVTVSADQPLVVNILGFCDHLDYNHSVLMHPFLIIL